MPCTQNDRCTPGRTGRSGLAQGLMARAATPLPVGSVWACWRCWTCSSSGCRVSSAVRRTARTRVALPCISVSRRIVHHHSRTCQFRPAWRRCHGPGRAQATAHPVKAGRIQPVAFHNRTFGAAAMRCGTAGYG